MAPGQALGLWVGLVMMPRMPSPLTGDFPSYRPRRLRGSETLRRMVRETRLHPDQLVLPLFIRPGRKVRNAVPSMPGVFQLSIDEAVREAARAQKAGVPAVILFGIPSKKDARASGAYAKNGIVQKAVRHLKRDVPGLLVITDVCLCEYMSHGHCGLVKKSGKEAIIDNDPSLKLLARTAVSHAEAGADVIAPSDMMDGRVAAIRTALDSGGFNETPIMSYAAKFASACYGPFRDAAESTPQFGDRRSYQMDAANAEEALREVESSNDPESFSRADESFHLALAESTRNPLMVWLYRHINDVRGHAQWSVRKDKILTPTRIAEYNAQHRALFAAIESRDTQAAVDIMTRHLEKARADLLGAT